MWYAWDMQDAEARALVGTLNSIADSLAALVVLLTPAAPAAPEPKAKRGLRRPKIVVEPPPCPGPHYARRRAEALSDG
jgi:hypothetical protein